MTVRVRFVTADGLNAEYWMKFPKRPEFIARPIRRVVEIHEDGYVATPTTEERRYRFVGNVFDSFLKRSVAVYREEVP